MGKGWFFCMHTLRAGENFAQPRPFLLKGLTECKVLLTVDCGANKVCCWLGLLRWTSALPGRSKNCKLEKGIPGFARTLPCCEHARGGS